MLNGLQKREITITLAVLDIYVLDFVINIGENEPGMSGGVAEC